MKMSVAKMYVKIDVLEHLGDKNGGKLELRIFKDKITWACMASSRGYTGKEEGGLDTGVFKRSRGSQIAKDDLDRGSEY